MLIAVIKVIIIWCCHADIFDDWHDIVTVVSMQNVYNEYESAGSEWTSLCQVFTQTSQAAQSHQQ